MKTGISEIPAQGRDDSLKIAKQNIPKNEMSRPGKLTLDRCPYAALPEPAYNCSARAVQPQMGLDNRGPSGPMRVTIGNLLSLSLPGAAAV